VAAPKRLKKRVNRKAVLILAGSCLALAAGVHFVHGYQVKRNARGLLDEADRAERAGRPAGVADALAQYLQLEPGDADARARYGLLLSRTAGSQRERYRAYLALGDALWRAPDRPDLLRELARRAAEFKRFGEAREHLAALRKLGPPDAELLTLQARCEAAEKQFGEAVRCYEAAATLAPRDVDLAAEFAALLRLVAKSPELAEQRPDLNAEGLADRVMERLVQAADGAPAARLAAARYHARWGAAEKAEQLLAPVVAGADPDADALLLAAEVARARRRAEAARGHLERGVRRFPGDARFALELARLELGAGRREQALACLGPCLAALPERPEQLWALGNLLIDLGEPARAEEVVARLQAGQPGWAVDFLRGRLLMLQGAWGQARQVLDRGLKAAVPPPAEVAGQFNLRLAECHAQLANPDQQAAACRRVPAGSPAWVPARRMLAAALTALGNTDQAIGELRALAADAPEARLELARLLLARNRRLPAPERRWDEVEGLLGQAPEGREAEVAVLRTELLADQGKAGEARRLAEAQRDRDPRQPGPWLVLIRLAERDGKAEALLPLIDQAERQAGRHIDWHLARARLWARAGGPAAVAQLGKLEADLAGFPGGEGDRLLRGLGEAFLAAGDTAAAERVWRQLAGRRPDDLEVRYRLFALALQAGREDQAQSLLEGVRTAEGPGGPVAAYARAALYTRQARSGNPRALGLARQALAEAAALRPSWPRVAVLEAELYELEGQKPKALEKYQTARSQGEASHEVARKVLQLLQEEGRYAEAQEVLHGLPESALAAGGFGRVSAELSLRSAQDSRDPGAAETRRQALQAARKSVGDGSNRPGDYLWLGQMALLAGDATDAEAAFRRARDLSPEAPEVWVALVAFLGRTDARRADAELEAARVKLPRDRQPAVLAPCYELLGRLSEAEAQYLALAAAGPGDALALRNLADFYLRTGDRAKAEQSLRQLLAPGANPPPETAVWARRSLAVTLASRGDLPRFREAQTLLDASAARGEPTADDQFARALVLATQPDQRGEAIRVLKQLAGPASSMPAQRFLLAQLYEAEGEWELARREMYALLLAHERNPVYLAHYARSLLRRGEAAEAEPWVDRLAEVLGPRFEVLELKARVLKGKGRPDEAAGVLRAYATSKDAQPPRAARLLDELGFPEDAERVYRDHLAAGKDPQGPLWLAAYLARHDRLPEALDLCERARTTCPAELVARASVSALRTGRADRDQVQRVERWLTEVAGQRPDSVALLALLADLRVYAGRHDEAAALYRRILARSPKDPVALNNLAFLLAVKDGRTGEALGLINQAIDAAGAHPELLDTRAVIQVRANRADLALADLNQAVALAPSAAKYFHLAQARLLANERSGAREAYQKAVESGLTVIGLNPLEQPELDRLGKELGAR
jgi:predicted Zn-dependent protease